MYYIFMYLFICPARTTSRMSVDLSDTGTVSFHNFKSRNFKLSVSNPKNKYVAYVSVLFQISNCQGLGRKNKFEILKTDRRVIAVFIIIPNSNNSSNTNSIIVCNTNSVI